MDDFNEKLKDFIQFSRNNDLSTSEIKKEYLKLVKEFHPDKNSDFNLANEYMIKLNYVYEHLVNKKPIVRKNNDNYEKNMENGKYWFINDYGRKEYVKEKSLYFYKLALLEYQKCYGIMFDNSVFDGKKDESGFEIIKHLYECFKLAKMVIKIDKEKTHRNNVLILIKRAYKMNERITNGLKINNEKEIKIVNE